MFNLSWSEISIIAVLAIIIINPKDIPGLMRGAGKLVGRVKRMGKDFMKSIDEAADEVGIKEFKEQLENQQAIIGKITDLEGNEQETYDTGGLEDVSKKKGADDEPTS
jgi:sec-independent protein translocase protein TatB